ncbi:ATP-binding cassette domain-containing protein [Pedobacter faecalis]|uniref:ATP-binding cassette domain-containing protein n=1 Tax=Pedobacter faecalis TaxID=3041495 RepID=UPI002550EB38|nr:ATP-binding cassette domain-containing protein [Pedobacter sp. ELA7]
MSSGLHVDSVRKQFRGRFVLNDVFLSCQIGETVGLLGRNGSGKSTLLKIISGTLSADYKYISIDNLRVADSFGSRRLMRYLPQDSFLPSHISIESILRCFCSSRNADVLRQSIHVQPFLRRLPGDLSGGEKRIIEILLLLHSDAKYVLLDEPFNGLAPLHVEIVKDIIRSASGKGIVVTDHDYRNVLEISSRVILMQEGNTKKVNRATDLIDFGYLPRHTVVEWEAAT